MSRCPSPPAFSRGAVAVETAVAIALFAILAIAVVETARTMYVFVAAGEAARLGVRRAVVCGPNAPAVRREMNALLPPLAAGAVTVSVTYSPVPPDTATVAIEGLVVRTAIPGLGLLANGFSGSGLAWTLPRVVASLPLEAAAGSGDPACN